MKKISILLILIFHSFFLYAQQKNRFAIGFNFQPLTENSYEVLGEFKLSEHWAISEKIGYAGKANFLRPSFEYKRHPIGVTYDYISSGYFSKSGLQYTFTNKFFVLASLIISKYNNSQINAYDDSTVSVSNISYISFVPALSCGYRAELIKNCLFFDMGVQLSFDLSKKMYENFPYYLAGRGTNLTDPVRTQGIMGLMLAF